MNIQIERERYKLTDKTILDDFFTNYKKDSFNKSKMLKVQTTINEFTSPQFNSCFCTSTDIDYYSELFHMILTKIKEDGE